MIQCKSFRSVILILKLLQLVLSCYLCLNKNYEIYELFCLAFTSLVFFYSYLSRKFLKVPSLIAFKMNVLKKHLHHLALFIETDSAPVSALDIKDRKSNIIAVMLNK